MGYRAQADKNRYRLSDFLRLKIEVHAIAIFLRRCGITRNICRFNRPIVEH